MNQEIKPCCLCGVATDKRAWGDPMCWDCFVNEGGGGKSSWSSGVSGGAQRINYNSSGISQARRYAGDDEP